ncbi:hypothetical protein HDU77_007900 [Chytriomyces hyalinus]|nr:hypothetical protein HDU77_007900 [Chytriomyces hyalinus]
MARILMLQGYAQNEAVFRKRTAILRKDMQAIGVELVYCAAPHLAPLPEQDQISEAERLKKHQLLKQEEILTGWWVANAERTAYHGYKETIHMLKRFWIEKGPFDGIIGFSQGAALAPLLVTELAFAQTTNDSNIYTLPKFMLLFSGFVPIAVTSLADAPVPEGEAAANSGVLDHWTEGRIPIPSMHVIGAGDAWVLPRDSHALAARFVESSSVVVEHDGGHYIPTSSEMRLRFKEFVTLNLNRQ